MNNKMKQRIERVLALADTSLDELKDDIHKNKYTVLAVHLDSDGSIDGSIVLHDRLPADDWRIIFKAKTFLCEEMTFYSWGTDEATKKLREEIWRLIPKEKSGSFNEEMV